MVNTVLILCGGNGTRFNGQDKPGVECNGRTFISYVCEAVSKAGISRAIAIANERNYVMVKEEVAKHFSSYHVYASPPGRFREAVKYASSLLGTDPFLLVGGNQPMDEAFIRRMLDIHASSGEWVVSLYDKNDAEAGQPLVSLDAEHRVVEGDVFCMQHPFIISTDLVDVQEQQGFANTIENTIHTLIKSRGVKGVIADMPREFDDTTMYESSKDYVLNRDKHLVLLPGNNLSNKEWIEECAREFKTIFPHSTIQYYRHWSLGQPVIDVQYEMQKLLSTVQDDKRTVIFAKSAGILVTLNAISRGLLKPAACIFLGLPIHWARAQGIDIAPLLKNIPAKTVILQNSADPFGSAEEVRTFVKDKGIRVDELPGDTHDYSDLKIIKEKTCALLRI